MFAFYRVDPSQLATPVLQIMFQIAKCTSSIVTLDLIFRLVTLIVHVAVYQVFCVFLFLVAASFFATLISQLNEIIAAKTTKTKVLDDTMASYLTIHPRSVWKTFTKPY